MKSYSAEQIQVTHKMILEVVNLYRIGVPVAKIARYYDVSRNFIYKILKDNKEIK